jgi:hypothetical protein
MRGNGERAWFAKRTVRGLGDDGGPEQVTIWIERKPGALWAVGRAVGLAERRDGAIRRDDYVFEGYEMGDALEAANDALQSDLAASGNRDQAEPFAEDEVRERLERWFFGHAPR